MSEMGRRSRWCPGGAWRVGLEGRWWEGPGTMLWWVGIGGAIKHGKNRSSMMHLLLHYIKVDAVYVSKAHKCDVMKPAGTFLWLKPICLISWTSDLFIQHKLNFPVRKTRISLFYGRNARLEKWRSDEKRRYALGVTLEYPGSTWLELGAHGRCYPGFEPPAWFIVLFGARFVVEEIYLVKMSRRRHSDENDGKQRPDFEFVW